MPISVLPQEVIGSPPSSAALPKAKVPGSIRQVSIQSSREVCIGAFEPRATPPQCPTSRQLHPSLPKLPARIPELDIGDAELDIGNAELDACMVKLDMLSAAPDRQ